MIMNKFERKLKSEISANSMIFELVRGQKKSTVWGHIVHTLFIQFFSAKDAATGIKDLAYQRAFYLVVDEHDQAEFFRIDHDLTLFRENISIDVEKALTKKKFVYDDYTFKI